MRCLVNILVAGLIASFGSTAPAQKKKRTQKLKTIKIKDIRLGAYAPGNRLQPGATIAVGDYKVEVVSVRPTLALHWSEGAAKKVTKLSKPKRGDQVVSIGIGPKRKKLLIHRDRFNQFFHLNPSALRITLDRQKIIFYDLDYDGVFMEIGVDGWGFADASHYLPMSEDLIIGAKVYRISSWENKPRKASFEVQEIGKGLPSDSIAVLKALNETRLYYGLQPCEIDLEISRKYCQPHAAWMALNGLIEHREPPHSAGFTKEGNIGGINSLVVESKKPGAAFFYFLDTPLHGYEISSPFYTKTAIGAERGFVAIWWTLAHGMKWPAAKGKGLVPAVFPPHKARGIPVSWSDEFPDPREGDPEHVPWGYPIRVFLEPSCGVDNGVYPTKVEASLREERTKKEESLQLVYDPSTVQPHAKMGTDYVEFIVLPRRPLERKTTYALRMKWTYKGKETQWASSFTTGTQNSDRDTLQR